jgi:ABC-type glycerol-3-phosphate transport system permease component
MVARLDMRKLIMTVIMVLIGIAFLMPFFWMISAAVAAQKGDVFKAEFSQLGKVEVSFG